MLLLKKCPKCKVEYRWASKHFYKNKTTKDGFSWECKSCCDKRNKKRYFIRRKLWREFFKQFNFKCEVCGYDKCFAAIDFHHRNPEQKEFKMSNLVRGTANLNENSKRRFLKELDKCQILCANCHRELYNGGD